MSLFKLPEINKEQFLRFLPSKKFGFYILVILCVPIFAFILFSKGGVVPTIKALITGQKTAKEIEQLQALATLDTDKDGLDDWQEALWKTDFKKPDTDGDGTKDGEEVEANRDPLIAGPNDLLSTTLNAKSTTTAASDNLTEEVSKNLLIKYMTTKKILGGNTVSQEEKDLIVNSTFNEANLVIEQTKLFTDSDIKTTSDNSVAAIKKYGNSTGAILLAFAKKVNPTEDTKNASSAIQNANKEELAKLNNSILAYNEAEAALLKITTPSSLKEKHLELINTFYLLRENTKSISLYFSDPMQAAYAIKNQSIALKKLVNIFISLDQSFNDAGILFKESEPGFFIQNSVDKLPI